MSFTLPQDMENLVYFTRRKLEPSGHIVCWVEKQPCPKCHKGLLSKPRDPKTNKVKIRAKEYICQHCGFTQEKNEYEETLQAKAVYTCPHCSKEGEAIGPFKRRTIKGVKTLRLQCEHCGGNLDMTKKMKEPKKKKSKK